MTETIDYYRKLQENDSELKLARISSVFNQNLFLLLLDNKEVLGTLKGSLQKQLTTSVITGDWVGVHQMDEDRVQIVTILPRTTELSRKRPGTINDVQLIVSNIDLIFIVTSMNQEFNPRRLERYVFQAKSQHIKPIIILTKSDLATDTDFFKATSEKILESDDVVLINALDNQLANIRDYLLPQQTIALVGSSGVGKSTLLNALIHKNITKTQQLSSATGKGLHTTTNRKLHLLDNGTFVIDTPGIRELGSLSDDKSDLDKAFPDIASWASLCFFSDCKHNTEKGCAVNEAIAAGALEEKRLINYKKMLREQNFIWVKGSLIPKKSTVRKKEKRASYNRKKKHKVPKNNFEDYL